MFRQHGLKLNRGKCTFAEHVLEALGHKIDASGIHKSDTHIRAVRDAPKPVTPEELQLFFGKATYYNSFILDLSTRDRPLRDMLFKDPFVWTPEGNKAYEDIKNALTSPQVLIQYDPTLPLLLATDASKTGLGAVLSHRLSNGQERPIAYASRTMTVTEQKYPQIDKEALAIVWAVQKFFNYLEEAEDFDDFDCFTIHQTQQLPVRAEAIARETRKDLHLGKNVEILEDGQDLVYHNFKAPEVKYTLAANCLMFEHRVVIPPSLRDTVLNDLHVAHLGIVKMKGLARSFVFWPGIDADIETLAKSCTACATQAHDPSKFRDHHWKYSKAPWERIHIDYAGPVANTMLLIVVDAYSKWVEVKPTTLTTATSTIAIMDNLFTAYGTPITVVSDNGRQFIAEEFKTFLKNSGVKYHKLSAPYKTSNLNQFLRQYRKAPHSTTGQSPAQLFLGRDLRTSLNLTRPDDISTKVLEKQRAEMQSTFRTLEDGQRVYFLSANQKLDKWLPGTISKRIGDLHYEINYEDKQIRRHVDQIRIFQGPIEVPTNDRQRHIRYYEEPPIVPATRTSIRELEPPVILENTPHIPMIPRRSNRVIHPPLRYSPN
ncbi:uncharacterized protein K02A2.6-like [Sitophilus oryzae]|uniref:RNA-directed DNA polymerase n=1 Tax=Sitophilus oryzae TaxID=7048 RepID=A0A6J2YXZ0_SITOR|nr:uncharacterized protein K02A2.6-like [Sitophilus oryzae]